MKDLLNEMVAERDTSDPHDFNGKEQDLSISKLSSAAFNITLLLPRGVARGGPGGQSPPEFVRSVNLIQTMRGGADYARHTTASPLRIQNAIYTSISPLRSTQS